MRLDDESIRVSHSARTDEPCAGPAESGPSSYAGPVTIDGHEAYVRLAVDVEEHEWFASESDGTIVRHGLRSWLGTLQLRNPGDAYELLVPPANGRRTLVFPDGRTAEVAQRSVDSYGQVEVTGLGPAPWWRWA